MDWLLVHAILDTLGHLQTADLSVQSTKTVGLTKLVFRTSAEILVKVLVELMQNAELLITIHNAIVYLAMKAILSLNVN